jgi:hypothetical protein
MRPAPNRRRIWPAWIVLLWACCGQAADAATGTRFTVPTGAKPAVHGLRLALDWQWVHGYGYRPVAVEVICTPPATADRALTIELAMASWSMRPNLVTVSAEVEIPAGSRRVSRVICVPQFSDAQSFTLKVWEDGSLVEDLSLENQSLGGGGYWRWDSEPVRILFVDDNPIDVSQFHFLTHDPYGQTPPVSRPADAATFDQRAASVLFADWINYSSLDLVFISLADFQGLADKRPDVFRALVAWTRAGGNLCVFGVGSDWHGLAELEQRLGCPAGEPEAGKKYRGWETASNLVFEQAVVPAAQTAAAALATSGSGAPPATIAPSATAPAAPPTPPFAWKPAAFGLVVGIADADPFPGDSLTWRWLLESIGPQRTRWHVRHGTVPDQPNPQFNDFLIADVGLPPIRTYRVLITLFVVAIGPVNYWLLRRRGRLHLFLFTVPAAALVTSIGLLGYALVADGFESRLRARSLTFLDQQSGQSVSHARLSYYTGLAPSGGLRFSEQTAIVPLELSPADGPFGGQGRQLVWDDGQHLTRGWLGSRMPTQYVTVRAHESRRQLARVPGGDPARMTVENRLGVGIKQLLCCDAAGQLHHGGEIAPGKPSALQPVGGSADVNALLLKFSRAISRDAPALPGTMSVFDSSSRWFFSSRRMNWQYGQQSSADTSTSLLETELARIKSAVMSQRLEPGTYVAIVERPAEIETGTDGLTESQSLHVICGRL